MSASEKRVELAVAEASAARCVADLEPYCVPGRLVVVGSVRRKAATVGDIEVMLMPLPSTARDLFGQVVAGANQVEEHFEQLAAQWGAQVLMAGPKKKTLRLREGLKLEIHLSNSAAWGVEMVIRTGPEEFTRRCVTARRQSGYLPSNCRVTDGWQVRRGAGYVPMPTEGAFLQFLGFAPNLAPESRSGNLRPGVSVETEARDVSR